MALEGLPKTFPAHDRPYVAEIEEKLYQAVLNHTSSYAERLVMEGNSQIDSVAFSPDGKTIVTAGEGGAVHLWNAADGQRLHTLIGHTDWVTHVAFSADGSKLVTTSRDKTARLWDGHSGKPLSTLSGHTGWVTHAAFSMDSSKLVTASDDKTARLWDGHSGKPLSTLRGHTGSVTHVVFSADGSKLVTASSDKTARLWDGQSGKPLLTLSGHTGSVTHAVFNADGSKLVTTSRDKTVRLWRVFSTKELIDYANQLVPRCLTPEQRQEFFLSSDPARDLIEKGEQWAQAGEIQKAIAQFQLAKQQARCLKFEPTNKARQIAATALLEEGKELAEQGQIPAAVVKFTNATTVDPRLKLDKPEYYAKKLAQEDKVEKAIAKFDHSSVLKNFRGSLEWVHAREPYSGKPYWPGGYSGITLDPGIDLGHTFSGRKTLWDITYI